MARETEGALSSSIQAGDQPDPRRLTRFDLDMSLVARHTRNRSRIIQGRIIDLCRDGIRAVIASELQVGDILALEFGLPYTSAIVQLEAVIRWRQHYQYGLEFVRVTDSDRERINQTCVALELLR